MKPHSEHYLLLSRKMGFIIVFILILVSCTKSSDSNSGSNSNSASYCGTIGWSNTNDQAATYTGSKVDNIYGLVYYTYTENGSTGGFPLHYDANNHLISDQPGVTYTYNADTLTKITVTGQSGNGSYNFDGKGHFIYGNINLAEQESSGTVTGTYTYDKNEDPVHISAVGLVNTPDGALTSDIEVDGDFLTDKYGYLPFIPVMAPASSLLSFLPFLSKHLLNKWNVTINGTINGVPVPTEHLTIQYTYTFNQDGYVDTMVRSDGPITYTFTYADCD